MVTYRYPSSKQTEARGSDSRFLSLTRPRRVFMRMRSPSRRYHITDCCGAPSGLMVARVAYRFSSRNETISGARATCGNLQVRARCLVATYLRRKRSEVPDQEHANDAGPILAACWIDGRGGVRGVRASQSDGQRAALAIDIGTSSVRSLSFDLRGRAVAGSECQIGYDFTSTADGGAFVDARELLAITARCVDRTLAATESRHLDIAVVGIACFWHSLLGLDAEGRPTTPVLLW